MKPTAPPAPATPPEKPLTDVQKLVKAAKLLLEHERKHPLLVRKPKKPGA